MDAALFEGGTDDEGSAAGGQGPCEEALRLACGDAGEVFECGSARDGECGELVLGEELAGAVAALLALGGGDGNSLGRAVFQCENGRRKARCAALRLPSEGVRKAGTEGERRSGCGGVEEESAARWHLKIVGW